MDKDGPAAMLGREKVLLMTDKTVLHLDRAVRKPVKAIPLK